MQLRCSCIAVFDFDGVIVEKGDEKLVRPKTLQLLKAYISMGCKIVVLSGRKSSDKRKIVNMLWDYGIYPQEILKIILRPLTKNALEETELEWKAKHLAALSRSRKELRICEVHEDNIEVLEWVSKNIPDACLVLHQPGNVLVIYKSTRNCIVQDAGLEICGGSYSIEEEHVA